MFLSVIVPIFNSEKYLSKCVDSILAGIPKDAEILLINDGSTDRSGEIAEQYASQDSRVKAFLKANGGVSSARNFGVNLARGEYTAFVDSDDWVSPKGLELVLEIIKQKKPDALHGLASKIHSRHFGDERGATNGDVNYFYESPFEMANDIAIGSIPGYCYTFIFKTNILKDIRFDESLPFMEDAVFCIEALAGVSSLIQVEKSFYRYFQNPDGASKGAGKTIRNVQSALKAGYTISKLISSMAQVSTDDFERVARIRMEFLGRQILSAVGSGELSQRDYNFLAVELNTTEEFRLLIDLMKFCDSPSVAVFNLKLIRHRLKRIGWGTAALIGLALRTKRRIQTKI